MLDYLVVGAGPSGLCAAKTILECEPDATVKLVDANKTLGGVWAKENIYPGLKTNNLRGGIDFSDFPMHDGFGIAEGEHVSGEVMHQYLVAYAERSGLVGLIDFEAQVLEISQLQNGQGWDLKIRYNNNNNTSAVTDTTTGTDSTSTTSTAGTDTTTATDTATGHGTGTNTNTIGTDNGPYNGTDTSTGTPTGQPTPTPTPTINHLQTKNLIIATGITNRPNRPFLIGTAAFDGPIIHSSELGKQGASLLHDPAIDTVAVIGGGKSAFDAVHMFAKTGHTVHWIIRRSVKGPEWIFPAQTNIGPFQVIRERLATRRVVTLFSPCLWNDGFGWIRRFLHFTRLGKVLTRAFWAGLYHKAREQRGVRGDMDPIAVLEPETSPFWYGTASGIYAYEPDLYSMVRTHQIQVHREDISYLRKHTMVLTNRVVVKAQAIITATGFSAKPTYQFTPSSTHFDLGIPTPSLTPEQYDIWTALDRQADATIASKFPELVAGPVITGPTTVYEPPSTTTRALTSAASSTSTSATTTSSSTEPPITKAPREILETDMRRFTPFRLYRAIAPPGLTARGDRSLVFIGMFSNLANTPRCELQCLWAYAYLNGKLDDADTAGMAATGTAGTAGMTTAGPVSKAVGVGTPTTIINRRTVFEETALMSRYARFRAPYGHGRFFPDLVFDQLPYCDLLLQDLRLKYWRKKNWVAELCGSYVASDYAGVVQEWIEAQNGNNKDNDNNDTKVNKVKDV